MLPILQPSPVVIRVITLALILYTKTVNVFQFKRLFHRVREYHTWFVMDVIRWDPYTIDRWNAARYDPNRQRQRIRLTPIKHFVQTGNNSIEYITGTNSDAEVIGNVFSKTEFFFFFVRPCYDFIIKERMPSHLTVLLIWFFSSPK